MKPDLAEIARQRFTRHGHNRGQSPTPTHRAWSHMLSRCRNPRVSQYQHYGARGIKVCDRWLKFENFLADMGERPTGKSLDRINNNGNYEPANCRWATQSEQCRNQRTNRLITFDGKTQTLTEWAEQTGIQRQTIAWRLDRGWTTGKALEMKEAEAFA